MPPVVADPPIPPRIDRLPVPHRPFDLVRREEFVRLWDVPSEVYQALREIGAHRKDLRLTYGGRSRGGWLEIERPAGPPADVTPAPPGGWREEFIRLHDVPGWVYLALLETEGNEHACFTYSDGVLEIEVPTGFPHENVSELLKAMIVLFVVERNVEFRPTGSADLVLRGLPRGLRGDSSYYVRRVAAIAGRDEIDLDAGDPPPDLAVEVVFGSPLGRKRAIYSALGVGELWVWERGALTASVLTDVGAYEPAADSPNLPGFPFALAADLIARRDALGQTELLRRFREAVRDASTGD